MTGADERYANGMTLDQRTVREWLEQFQMESVPTSDSLAALWATEG